MKQKCIVYCLKPSSSSPLASPSKRPLPLPTPSLSFLSHRSLFLQVHYISGRVASLYCDTLAATLDVLKPPTTEAVSTAQHTQQGSPVPAVDITVWEEYRRLNTQYALQVRVCKCVYLCVCVCVRVCVRVSVREGV